MIREITGYERRSSARIKKQKEETGIWRSVSLVSLCLNTSGEGGESGELYHLCGEKPVIFSTLFQAVNQMEELYDELLPSRVSAGLRSFWSDRSGGSLASEEICKGAEAMPKEAGEDRGLKELLRRRGARATFWIQIMYRQHMSWQGEVTWVDRQRKEYFRSTLELLRLLDSALCTDKKEDRTPAEKKR